jgi:hypothetical protein
MKMQLGKSRSRTRSTSALARSAPALTAPTRESPAHAATGYRRDRRAHGPSQDHALYGCQCGLQFEAPVSTSVRCPCCGGGQAW